MLQSDIEGVFDFFCSSNLYGKIQYPLYLSGTMDDIEEEILESFLEQYHFDVEKTLHFDEFKYHFNIFEGVIKRNDLPIKYI